MPHAAEPAGSVAAPPFDLAAATAFLHEQAETMVAGLRSVDDPLAVRAVLRSHDGGHGAWLRLIAAVTPLDPETGETLSSLYAFHGRVAGWLERTGRRATVAGPPAGRELSQRLEAATVAAVVTLEAVERSLWSRPER